MPDRDVSTIREITHYQCAKTIAKSAFAASDGGAGTLFVLQAEAPGRQEVL
jgi:hypothetical protein